MAVKPIIKTPSPVLTHVTKTVKNVDEHVKQLVQDLLDTLTAAHDPEGVGLAAPQIGSNLRVCIVRRFISDPNEQGKHIIKDYVLINPKISSKSDETDVNWEGCLSIPDTYGKVERAKKLKVAALNENGEEIKYNATGFFARIMQHEIDHLDGILFTTKVIGKTLTEKELDALTKEQTK